MHIFLYAINFANINITKENLIYILIPAILILAAIVFSVAIYRNSKKSNKDAQPPKEDEQDRELTFENALRTAGYGYDSTQDIFYSIKDAWQRKYGYCQLYDEACAPLSMIIDCEPIYFDYDNKHWLIEFWKGQYGMTAGCEVGVYISKGLDLNIEGVFNGTFYEAADEEDNLEISYVLYKNKKQMFTRQDRHWWLTGFKLGDFAQPNELSMDIKIVFKDNLMQNAFIRNLKQAGYKTNEYRAINNIVLIAFTAPHTKQPYTRTEDIEYIMQTKNMMLCQQYQEIVRGMNNIYDKVNAVKAQAPELYKAIFKMGKTKQVFDKYEDIRKFL